MSATKRDGVEVVEPVVIDEEAVVPDETSAAHGTGVVHDPRRKLPMSAETMIFAFIAVFFLVVAPIYWFSAHEIAGTWVLGLAGALGAMITAYLQLTRRHINDRPEDDVHGEMAQGVGQLGFFPPRSIWPFWCAVTLALIALGPPFGWWPSLLGLGLGVWALTGWVYEFYRGVYKH